jgi:hypothetical protein
VASDLAGPSHRHRAIYEVRHQRFRCPNSDGNCLGSSKLWDSRTRASVRASVGNGQAPGRRDGLHAIRSVLQRHGRLTQSRWSCPQQRRSRDWTPPCQIRTPRHHDAWPTSLASRHSPYWNCWCGGNFSKVDGVGSSVEQDRAVVATGMSQDGWKDARRQRGVLSD